MDEKDTVFQRIVRAVRDCAARAGDLTALEEYTVDLIAERLLYYNWVGFYMLDPDEPSVLALGPFRGAPTDHLRIPVTEGICGAAAAQGESIVVDDVRADPRYLACSLETRSEIVVPIRAAGRVVGEIDVDSHSPAAFGPTDQAFLEECAGVVGQFIAGRAQ